MFFPLSLFVVAFNMINVAYEWYNNDDKDVDMNKSVGIKKYIGINKYVGIKKYISLAILPVLAGCTEIPNDTILEKAFYSAAQSSKASTILTVDNFAKVSGYKKNDQYIAEVSYDIRFIENQENNTIGHDVQLSGLGLHALSMEYGQYKVGDISSNQQQVIFVKTSDGWTVKI